MSEPVPLDVLWERVAEFGEHPYLVTVNSDGSGAHVVSVSTRVVDDRAVLTAGGRTRTNLAANPAATLLWPGAPGGAYSLIVDGHGTVLDGDEGEVAITPSRAVLHRVAGAAEANPSCVPVLPAD
jgi:hypothetical protein